MPLIWTDDDGQVTCTHYKPSMISYADAKDAIEVDTIPDPDPDTSGTPELYYTESDGFWYEYVGEQ